MNEYVITDELFERAQLEMAKGNNWIVYNIHQYFLDRDDLYFFPNSDEAHELVERNLEEENEYRVFHADSVIDLFRRLPYGDSLEQALIARADSTPQQHVEKYLPLKFETMIEKNLDYLKSNLRNHGFGETMGPELEAALKNGQAEFTLAYKTEVNKHEMEATLYFKKSDSTELYFFNKYDTRLKSEKDETMAQTFYINNGWGVTLKEAYNLLNGRAVHKELTNKEGEQYKAWIQLDFSAKDKHGNFERKTFHENYGYDLKEALSYYPVKELLKEEEMKNLVRSLERGNVQMVTMQLPEKEMRMFIEAAPQYKGINVYDNRMNRLDRDKREELMKKPELAEGKEKDLGKSKEKKESLVAEEQGGKKQKGAKKTGSAEKDDGLVKKTRTRSAGKGMGV